MTMDNPPSPKSQLEQAEEHMYKVLDVLGFFSDDLIDHREHYEGTPMRFVKYLKEFLQPFDPEETLKTFKSDVKGLVIETSIPYRQVCAHHLLPAFGYAAIGYMPSKKIVGLSKLVRIVDRICTSRPSVQETLCEEIADTIDDYLEPRGVMAVIKAEHGCISCRGVKAPAVGTITSSVRGVFRDVPALRSEFLSLIKTRGVRE